MKGYEKYETDMRGGHLMLSQRGHAKWMVDYNPEGWDNATWAAYAERIATDRAFAARVRDAFDERHHWASEEFVRQVGGRAITDGFRIDLRREINTEAVMKFRRPHPTADGWVPSKHFDPLAGLTKRMSA